MENKLQLVLDVYAVFRDGNKLLLEVTHNNNLSENAYVHLEGIPGSLHDLTFMLSTISDIYQRHPAPMYITTITVHTGTELRTALSELYSTVPTTHPELYI